MRELARALGDKRAFEIQLFGGRIETEDGRRKFVHETWQRPLGAIEPQRGDPKSFSVHGLGGATVQKIKLSLEADISVPLFLVSSTKTDAKAPVVVGVCQEGKDAFLKHNAEAVAKLVDAGIVVCLADLRGTGETKVGSERGRRSSATGLSSTDLMLGQPLLAPNSVICAASCGSSKRFRTSMVSVSPFGVLRLPGQIPPTSTSECRWTSNRCPRSPSRWEALSLCSAACSMTR